METLGRRTLEPTWWISTTTTALVPGMVLTSFFFTKSTNSLLPYSSTLPLPQRRTIRGGPSKAFNITVIRPLPGSWRCDSVSTPDPVRSWYLHKVNRCFEWRNVIEWSTKTSSHPQFQNMSPLLGRRSRAHLRRAGRMRYKLLSGQGSRE